MNMEILYAFWLVFCGIILGWILCEEYYEKKKVKKDE